MSELLGYNSARFILITLVFLVVSACGSGEIRVEGDFPSKFGSVDVDIVRGVVIGVDSASISELRTLDVEDRMGEKWHFVAVNYMGFTPSHLREHMLSGLPISVTYHEEGGDFVIDEIVDWRMIPLSGNLSNKYCLNCCFQFFYRSKSFEF